MICDLFQRFFRIFAFFCKFRVRAAFLYHGGFFYTMAAAFMPARFAFCSKEDSTGLSALYQPIPNITTICPVFRPGPRCMKGIKRPRARRGRYILYVPQAFCRPLSLIPVPGLSPEPVPGLSPEPVTGLSPEPVTGLSHEPVPDLSPEPVPDLSPEPVTDLPVRLTLPSQRLSWSRGIS